MATTNTTSPLIDRVRALPAARSLRAAIEEAARAAREMAAADAGRAIDRPTGTYAGKLASRLRVHVAGLKGSSTVLLAEAIRQSLGRSLLLVYPDDESAEDAASDFRTLSTGHVVRFPERSLAPHRFELRENLAAGGDRNESLLTILNGGADVVVTSALGFIEKTITRPSLTAHQRLLTIGDTVDLDDLREHLVAMGYDAVSVVEEAGQFAVRGAIVDLFDPAWDYPARVELEGDEVASMRSFDLDTQRSLQALQSCTLLPASSVPLDDSATAHLRAYLAARDFPEDLVERIADEAEHSRSSYVWRRYAPALGMTGSLLDFFPEPPVVWFVDGEGVNRAAATLAKEFAAAATRPEDEYPALGLEDYVHALDHGRAYGAPVVIHWALADVPATDPATAALAPAARGRNHAQVPDQRAPECGRKTGSVVHAHPRPARQTRRGDDLLGNPDPARASGGSAGRRRRSAGAPPGGMDRVRVRVGRGGDRDPHRSSDFQPHARAPAKARAQSAASRHSAPKVCAPATTWSTWTTVSGASWGWRRSAPTATPPSVSPFGIDGGDRIFVPLDQMHLVEKYLGREGVVPHLDRLAGTRWQTNKEKARKAIEDIARDLLHMYAQREIAKAYAFSPDTQWQRELEASFPYEETPHQITVRRKSRTTWRVRDRSTAWSAATWATARPRWRFAPRSRR